jgi:hypothetical protein
VNRLLQTPSLPPPRFRPDAPARMPQLSSRKSSG